MEGLLLPIALAGAFYFILLRPMLSQQKKKKATLAELNIGDEVLTTSGFFATVTDIVTPTSGPMRIHLELTEDVIVEATPDAVVSIIPVSEVEESELATEEVEDLESNVEAVEKAESEDS
jgi:preprotein translocase YajC subunit|tara:strand:- start:8447 stop:8806 length:360 start_codon:yes stop_codon:yes gene_type:complete